MTLNLEGLIAGAVVAQINVLGSFIVEILIEN